MTSLASQYDRSSERIAAPLLAACLTYAWLVANTQIGWLRGAALLAELAILALPFSLVLRRVTGRLGFAEIITAAGIGLASLGGLGVVLIRLGLPDYAAELIFLLVGATLLELDRRSPGAKSSYDLEAGPAESSRASPTSSTFWWRIAAICALALPPSYIFFCAWLGGRGAFPGYMLTADLSSDLALIQSLLASHQIPPLMLPFAGGTMGYHYGSLEAVAHLVRLTGIPPHVALLYVALPVFCNASAAAAWLIARRLTSGGVALFAAAALLAACLFMSHDRLELKVRPILLLARWLTGHALDEPPFIRISPFHASISAGISISWICLMLLAYWQQRAARWLVAFATGLTALLDPFFFASAGLILGMWSLWQAWRTRHIRVLIIPASALAFALVLQRITGSTEAGYQIAPSLFHNAYVKRFALNTLWHGAALIGIIGLGCTISAARDTRRLALGILIIAVMLFGVANLTEMRMGGEEDSNFNWYRWMFIVPALIGIGAAAAIPPLLAETSSWRKYALLLLLLLAVPLQLLSYPVTGIQSLAAPTLRHDETLDTASLAEALSHIPVKDSLVVVSDLRYPSTDDPDNTPVVSAIYGHRCYLCVLWPSQSWAAEMNQRYADVKQLQASTWSPQLTDLARQRHWTHLLVRKAGPHPRTIPLALVFENEDYAVYRF